MEFVGNIVSLSAEKGFVMGIHEMLKLKAATLYILKQCGELDFIHLFKILYFAERQHYAHYGTHLVKDTFCALSRGPVPSFLYDAVKVAVHSKKVTDDALLCQLAQALKPGEADFSYFIQAAEEPDMEELSKADIACLDASIQENLSKDSQQLSIDSHDIAWQTAWNAKNNSSMDPFLIAEAGGALPEFISYLKEQAVIDKYLVQE